MINRLIEWSLRNRFLVLCGEDTKQLVGHLPGQCLESLHANGLDEKRRIVGAKGKRPFVKNVSPALVTDSVIGPVISNRPSGTSWVQTRLPSFRSPPGCRPAAWNCATT